MSATLLIEPSSPAYHRENNFVSMETDNITLVPGRVDLDIADGGPVLAETLEITWGSNTVTLTVEAYTNSSATAIPEQGVGQTLDDYAEAVFLALRENDLITAHFHVWRGGTVGSDERVSLVQIVPGPLDITATSGLTNVTVTVTDGEDPVTVDNLRAYLQVFLAADDPNDDERLVSLHAAYRTSDATAEFDLKDTILLEPALPDSGSITPATSSPWPHGEAYGAYAKYYLRYADKFGTPAVSEALVKTRQYIMLQGGKPGDFVEALPIGHARVQHAYVRADGGNFYKPVTLDQPDWIYLWVKDALTGINFEVEITWDEGTITTESVASSYFSFDAETLYWIASGPRQLDLLSFTAPVLDAQPAFYTLRMLADAGTGEETIFEAKYRVIPCHDFKFFLLMANGLAGCESVLLHGKKKWKYEAERDVARKMHWTTFSAESGDLFSYNAEGWQVIEANTGWHDKYYIEHLRQLLLGDTWIIDTVNDRFLRVLIETKSLDFVTEDDNTLYSLTLNIRAAWLDNAVRTV